MKKTYAGRIRDPLYDLIEFEGTHLEKTLWKTLQCPAFQRLRRIKQLGFSDYVYPGATHTRFAHSLGVFHTAKKLLGIISNILGRGFKQTKADEALAAALVHDIGHGPFSHAFERVGEEFGLPLANHEKVGGLIIRDSEVSEVLDSYRHRFSESVADMILAKGSDIYGAVVSSQFDADRLDYMQRDRLMAGTRLSGIDLTWLLSNLEIGSLVTAMDDSRADTLETFVLNGKAQHAAEAYILALFQLYPTVYFHKATRCMESMAAQMLIRIFSLARERQLKATGLPPSHPYIRFCRSPDNIDTVLALDDSVITGALVQLMSAPDPEIKQYAYHLHRRIIYKCFDISRTFEQKILDTLPKDASAEKIKNALKTGWDNHKNDILCWTKDTGVCRSHILMDSATRSPYNVLDPAKSTSPLNQIQVVTEIDRYDDISNVSSIVGSIKAFRAYRIYVDKSDKKSKNLLKAI